MDELRRGALSALRGVVDPEVGLDIVSMGLVYGLEATPEGLRLSLTLTSPGCPLGAAILGMARRALSAAAGGRAAEVRLVWDPPWNPGMIAEEARRALRG